MATSMMEKLVGLLPKNRCANGEVMMFAPCRSIHSFGMRSKLDIAFLDKKGLVLAAERELPACKLRSQRQAVVVLERRSCPFDPWPQVGDRLSLNFISRWQFSASLDSSQENLSPKEHEIETWQNRSWL
ncbi:MAG: DUF192 domain-containing protein [Coriobacteriales bacterium]|nr:DUF192 domain-containing protein [Coriobacteriales bacterium]